MGEEKEKRVYDTFEKKKVIVKSRTSSYRTIVSIIAIILFVFSVYKYGEKYNKEKHYIRVPATIHTIDEKGDRYILSFKYYVQKEPFMLKVPFSTSFKVPLNFEKTVAYDIENPNVAVFKYLNYYGYLIALSALIFVLNAVGMIKDKVKEKNKKYMNLIMASTVGLFITGMLVAFYGFFFERLGFGKLYILIPTQMTLVLVLGLVSLGIFLISLLSILIKKGMTDE